MSFEFPKSSALHIDEKGNIKKTHDDGSVEEIEDYNEYDELSDYSDEHKKEAKYQKTIKKESANYDQKRGKKKRAKPKTKDYRLN